MLPPGRKQVIKSPHVFRPRLVFITQPPGVIWTPGVTRTPGVVPLAGSQSALVPLAVAQSAVVVWYHWLGPSHQ